LRNWNFFYSLTKIIKGFLQQEKSKPNRCSKERVGSSPTEEVTPDGEIGRHVGQKNGNPLNFKDCYSKKNIALLTPWSWVRIPPGSKGSVAQLVEQVNNTILNLVR
jgi:hypothetical protein